MEITIINKDMIKTSSWAGGESKEYYIYPTESSYEATNFNIRLIYCASK